VNVFVLFRPRVSAGGGSWLLFDVVGVVASAALLVLAVIAGVRGTRALARAEGWAPRVRADRGPGRRVGHASLVEGEALSQV
jgi:hypothetical protein